ncbi:MAG: HAD-IC family P-type ATPase, partial [Pseudomonadota bacterium]|nr:HAD-IC family P-type ATPase [Pseudomonadota bacterium]
MTPEAVLDALDSRPGGLGQPEAGQRLARYGPNRLRPPKRQGPVARFLLQFHNVLIYVLLAATAVTLALGHWVDAAVIAAVVLLNALIGFVQEGKAEQALEAIRVMLSPQATALRDGRRLTLAAGELVPGDIVFVQSGDRVPADLRLIHARSLCIDEAALTGESVPVEKTTLPAAADVPLGDRRGMAFSGTLVTYGQGTGVVVATGEATEIGRISALLARVQPLTTPLLRQLAGFGRLLTVAILAMAALTFIFGVTVHDYLAAEMFLAAVGLAVAAIPEGLPAIVTITLAIGVQRMARRRAIIRRLPAVETLGAVTVICSDKTGTLTRNEMTVKTAVTARAVYQVTGGGYDPRGDIRLDGRPVAGAGGLLELGRAGLLCNDAGLEVNPDGGLRVHGDPMEVALVVLACKAGFDPELTRREFPRDDAIPFESGHRFMATLHHDHAGHRFVCLKGAPEQVLAMCSRQRREGDDEPLDAAGWQARIDAIAGQGQRVLAVAFKALPADQRELRFDHVQGGLTLLGLVGIIDPPRPEAVEAVAACRCAGIRVKMITGDHALTACAIGAQLGIGDGRTVLTGQALDGLDAAGLARAAAAVDVFARVSPEHKLRLVQALQARREVVAMTGDGVNDAPALKRADIGIAMGLKGTEAAKEAAEMVMADDNFASIRHAVEEGRTVYDNLRKAILFILPTNGGQAFTLIAAIAMGTMLPITPVQILWVNMITAVTLALSLAFEPAETDVMRRPPRPPRQPLLSGFLVWRIGLVSAILVAGTFGLFLWERTHGAPLDTARTVAVNTLVMFEAFYLLNTRYLTAPVLSRQGLLGNRYMLLAIALVLVFQLLFTYAGPMQRLFGTTALDAGAWLRIVLVGASVFMLVELEKALLHGRW